MRERSQNQLASATYSAFDKRRKLIKTLSRIIFPGLTFLVLTACGGGAGEDGGGGNPPPPVTSVLVSQVVDSAGGTVTVTNAASPLQGTQVVIPEGALSEPTTITISQVTRAGGVPGDVLVAAFGPTGAGFSVPVAVTIRHSPQYLSSNGIEDPSRLKVVALRTGSDNETLRTVAQDRDRNSVTAETTQFGRFAVLGYSNATLSGAYSFNFYINDPRFGSPGSINVVVPDTPAVVSASVPFPGYAFATELGTITFDGAGNYSWSGIRNNAGTPTAVGGGGLYTVSPDGVLALDIGPVGGVLAGGSTLVLTSTIGAVVEMGAGVRISGAFDNTSLNGEYGVAHYTSDANAGPLDTITLDVSRTPYSETVDVPFPAYAFNTVLRTTTFDGAGTYTWSGTRNRGGVTSAVNGSGTYSISTNGTLTLLDTGLTGKLLAGGSTFILTAPAGQPMEVGFGVKKGGTFGNASLGGSYTVTFYYSDPAAGPANRIDISIPGTPFSGGFDVPFPVSRFNTELRTMTFDGTGRYTWSGTRNRGGVSSAVSGSGSYAVAADGRLATDGGLEGNVLAGGSTFILTSTSGQALRIGVGILR